MNVSDIPSTVRWYARQAWRDLLSVYYANTPVWRWLKSGALLFFGFFLWTGSAVLQSVTGWSVLDYTMAYGFLLVAWGPFTHLVVVPLTIRLRRTAQHNLTRTFSRNSGKINLSVFLVCVILLATFAPGVMSLDFSPTVGGDGDDTTVSGTLVCESAGDAVSCQIEDPQGVDHVVVMGKGETIERVEGPPFSFEVERSDLTETTTGREVVVEFRDADGNTLRRLVERV